MAAAVIDVIPIDPARWEEGSRADPVRNEFVIPTILQILHRESTKRVIDVGCGTGYVSRQLSSAAGDRPLSWTLLDVDPSAIEYAARSREAFQQVEFVNSDLETYASVGSNSIHDLAILSYTVLEVEDLVPFMKALKAIVPEGTLVLFVPDVLPDVIDQYRGDGPGEPARPAKNGGYELRKINSFTNQRQTFIARQALDYVATLIDSSTRLETVTSYTSPRGSRHFALEFSRLRPGR